MSVGLDFALVNNTILVTVKELDRILDRQDVIMPVDIDLIDHRCQRSGFA